MEKPTLPKGTRDFGPSVMAKRQFILNTIRTVFQTFGFQPLETPAMENLSTLTGKYGEEGDQLLYKIIDSGEPFEKLKGQVKHSKTIVNFSEVLFDYLKQFTYNTSINSQLTVADIQNNLAEFFDQFEFDKHVDNSTVDEWQYGLLKNYLKKNIPIFAQILADFYQSLNYEVLEINKRIDEIKFSKFYDFVSDQLAHYYFSSIPSKKLTPQISEKGLRYDLTVPFARYVVMNQHDITFPFKRYQIQPVWRADKPQKGRYREFYQCDADVVGTNSLICEAEIILMIKEVFKGLRIEDYTIKINHRGVLSGIAEVIGEKTNETALFVAIDKLDKIGEEKVRAELSGKNFSEQSLTTLFEILNTKASTSEKLLMLSEKMGNSSTGKKGIQDIQEVSSLLTQFKSNDDHVEFDIALARGLSYYTGCIFEVKINNVTIGSVSGGGRYDNLTQGFGDKENLSGVGFSFGVDRLYDAMEELKIFPTEAKLSSKVLICHFDDESMRYGLAILTRLRANGIASEIYPDVTKLKKQLDFSNKKEIPFTIIIGSEEMKTGLLAFKDMNRGEQQTLTIEQIIQKLK